MNEEGDWRLCGDIREGVSEEFPDVAYAEDVNMLG